MGNSGMHGSRASAEANCTGGQALTGNRFELKTTRTVLLRCRGHSLYVTAIEANVVDLDRPCSNITGFLLKCSQTPPGPHAPTYNLITLSSTYFPRNGSGTLPC